MTKSFWVPLLCLFSACCDCHAPPPPPPPVVDMAPPTDGAVIVVRDFATGTPDLLGPDMATECIKCNAVTNPCPRLGLYCDGRTGCCDSNPH